MLEFLSLKPETFGLDVSDLSLKIIKLKKKREFLGLASFGEIGIKPGIIQEGVIRDEETLSQIIKEGISGVKGEKIKTKYAICSLPEEKAFLEVIQMPKMTETELEKAVYFEAENYIPLPIENVYFDSQIIPPLYNHLDHFDVLIAALPKEIVDPYLSCLKKAGLRPKMLEIESIAVARALIKNGVSASPVLLIDLGATKTRVIIFSGYSVRFTFSIPVSSQGFTESISRLLEVDLATAESLKIKYGLSARGTKEGREVFEALVPPLTDLIEQIKKYLYYYKTHASHEHLPPGRKGVAKILLCGGGATLKGLVQFIAEELKIPTELGNPWINILPKPLKEVPELPFEKSLGYTTALGLALRDIKHD
jgi:type IV pilus assembly protein PilM